MQYQNVKSTKSTDVYGGHIFSTFKIQEGSANTVGCATGDRAEIGRAMGGSE